MQTKTVYSSEAMSHLSEFSELLNAHIELLRNQYRFLLEIKFARISSLEILEYLSDVWGIKKPDIEDFKNNYLPIIENALLEKIKAFKKLLEISAATNQEAAISTLYLLCQSELNYEKLGRKLSQNASVAMHDKAQIVFGSITFLISALNFLEPHLPMAHEELTKIIYFEEKNILVKQNMQNKNAYSQVWKLNWPILLRQIKGILEKAAKTVTNKNVNKSIPDEDLEAFSTWFQMKSANRNNSAIDFEALEGLLKANSLISKRKAQNNLFSEFSNLANTFALIFVNILDYYQNISPLLVSGYKAISFVDTEYLIFKDLKKLDLVSKQKMTAKILAQNKTADLLILRIKLVLNKDKWQEQSLLLTTWLETVDEIKAEINELLSDWPKINTIDWSLTSIENKLEAVNTKSDAIKVRLNAINDHFLEIYERIESIEACTMHPQSESTILIAAQITERELFIRERQAIARERKQVVEQLRDEKQKAKKEIRMTETTTIQPKPCVQIFKGQAMEERLLQMNDGYFQLLEDIFALKKGILFSDICHLIINQLDGAIEELGSSHKRIRINKYIMEVITQGETMAELALQNQTVATGGFFRPHGDEHQSGAMSRFNLKLVIQIFEKAGISLEVLGELKDRRLEAKAEYSAFAFSGSLADSK